MQKALLESHWLELPGGKMHFLAGGEASDKAAVVVLVHGMVVSSRYMVPTAERLAPLCQVLAPDLPGYGQSFKPWPILSVPALADTLATWLDRLGIPRAHWVANSFGCQISADLAIRHPERVDRMVLQGPTVDPAARTLPQQLWRSLLNSPNEAKGLGKITRQDYRAAGLRRAWATLKLSLMSVLKTNFRGSKRRCSSCAVRTIRSCLSRGRKPSRDSSRTANSA